LCFRYLLDQAAVQVTDLVADLVTTGPAHQALGDAFAAPDELVLWQQQWQRRLATDSQSQEQRYQQMKLANPAFIARNHQVELAIRAAEDNGDYEPFYALLKVLQTPFEYQQSLKDYALTPVPQEVVHHTFCGT
jgi:uncharacterized protein YdiU (UPF0061 family)